MNCKNCGFPLDENDCFCKNCGAAVSQVSASAVEKLENDMNFSTPVNNMNNQVEQSMNSNMDTDVDNHMNQSMNNNMNFSTPVNNMNNHMNQSMSNGMNGQQAWVNGYNSQPVYNQMPQKNSSTKFIIIGVIIVAVIFAAILIVGTLKDDGSLNSGSGSSQTSNSTYNVRFKEFIFSIPDNLVSEIDNGVLLVGDELGTWAAQIELEQGSFAQLQSKKSQLQSVMQQAGFTSGAAQENKFGGVNFLTLEVSSGGTNAIVALAKANSMYFICITAFNRNNEFDYSLLEKLAPIVSSASYTGDTANIGSSINLDMSGIAGLAK